MLLFTLRFVPVDRRNWLVPVAVQFELPGIRSARGPPGRGRFGSVRICRPLGLGRGPRVDSDRLLHRLWRLRQLGLVVSSPPTTQSAHVLRLSRPSHYHDHDQLPNGRPSPPAQSHHGKSHGPKP